MDAETSSELTSENDNGIEDIGKIERQEVSAVKESELQSKDICLEINDVEDQPGDQHTGLEVENDQQIKSSVYKYEENLHFSSSKKTRYKKKETVFTKTPVITLNRIKSGRVDKSERLKPVSLRQNVLIRETFLKYFSVKDGVFTCCGDVPSEFKVFELKRPKMPDDETRNSSLESIEKNSVFPNEFQLHSASTNLSQEASTSEIQHSVSAQSNFVSPIIPRFNTTPPSQTKKIRSGEENDETRNSSLESIDKNSVFPNEFQLHSASTNLSQEASTSEIQHSVSAQSNFVSPIIPRFTATPPSQTKKIRSGEDVWNHFKGFLQANKESLDRILSDDPSSENMETSDYTNRSVKDAKMTVEEIVNQNIEEPFNTALEDLSKKLLGRVKTLVLLSQPNSALQLIHNIRHYVYALIGRLQKMLKNKQDQGRQEQVKLKEINYFSAAQKIRKLLQRYFEMLCDDQKLVDFLDQSKLYSRFCNLSNLTSLLELPLPATDIRSFYTLFLYLQKSLHSEVATEDVFKRIDSENCELAYQNYCERKALMNRRREMIENEAFGHISAFKKTLDRSRLIISHEISDFESTSLKDYKNFINDLRLDINDSLTCWYRLISDACLLVDPINSYLNVLRITTLEQLGFIDSKKPDVFSWLS